LSPSGKTETSRLKALVFQRLFLFTPRIDHASLNIGSREWMKVLGDPRKSETNPADTLA